MALSRPGRTPGWYPIPPTSPTREEHPRGCYATGTANRWAVDHPLAYESHIMKKQTKKSSNPSVRSEINFYHSYMLSILDSFPMSPVSNVSEKLLLETVSTLRIIKDWSENLQNDEMYGDHADLLGEISRETADATVILIALSEHRNTDRHHGHYNYVGHGHDSKGLSEPALITFTKILRRLADTLEQLGKATD